MAFARLFGYSIFKVQKSSYWFEFSKPLDSGDGHDWIWKPGDKVGTGLTGDLMIGSFGTSPVAGESYGCRLIQLQLAK
jgi:hypothetical protein